MASYGTFQWKTSLMILLAVLSGAESGDIFLEWVVNVNTTINPFKTPQPVITINGMFPGPLINTTTNDVVRLNVFNKLDEPLLFTWNGIEQRLNSWQDGVSGTNCPIQPGTNWTYQFQTKDQIGTFSYFPSINYLKVAGGFGPLRVNNRIVIEVPFLKPEAEFDLLIGDWFLTDYKVLRSAIESNLTSSAKIPDVVLMNGKGPHGNVNSKSSESFNVTKGKTYIFRVTNVGTTLSLNLRIQNHQMVVVETEGSYPSQITLDSLDIHVGQSYSVLVTANQDEADYYIVASPKMINTTNDSALVAKGVLHYSNSASSISSPLSSGPDPFDVDFSIEQAKSIRWNMTTGAARPNPQGTFNVTNVTLSETFILKGSISNINGKPRYVVNNVSYLTPKTPLKIADHFVNGTGVYNLDEFPVNSVNDAAVNGVFVATGIHKGWYEIVFRNDLDVMDSWHLDGFGFYVVGFGNGEWTSDSRKTYNLLDPVVRSTVQVYPGRWTAIYTFLDNQGMWNLRSQHMKHWYMGEELYIRVRNSDPKRAKERPPPENMLLCGIIRDPLPPAPAPAPAQQSETSLRQRWPTTPK